MNESKCHPFIHQTFKCPVCVRPWARYGVFSDAEPQLLPSKSSQLKDGRQVHQQRILRHHGDIETELCACGVGAPQRETFVCLGEGVEARGHFLKVVRFKLGLKKFRPKKTTQLMAGHEKPPGVSRELEGKRCCRKAWRQGVGRNEVGVQVKTGLG